MSKADFPERELIFSSERAEMAHIEKLCKAAGFRIPYHYDLPKARASFNFRATSAGVPTHKWTRLV